MIILYIYDDGNRKIGAGKQLGRNFLKRFCRFIHVRLELNAPVLYIQFIHFAFNRNSTTEGSALIWFPPPFEPASLNSATLPISSLSSRSLTTRHVETLRITLGSGRILTGVYQFPFSLHVEPVPWVRHGCAMGTPRGCHGHVTGTPR